MDGLFLGLIGGALVSIATIIGGLLVFFKEHFNFYKDSLLKLRLDFFVGLLLVVTAANLLYPATIEKNINLGIAAFILGVLFLILSKSLLKNLLETIVINNDEEQKAILLILVVVLKNIPVGLAAGAAMNLNHPGVGNSLLTALVFHNLIDGAVLVLCFLSLGFDYFIASMGAVLVSFVTIVASLSGAYLSLGSVNILPLIMAFAGGALMSAIMFEAASFVRREFKKILLNPSFVSVVVVMLIFIVWKELL
jgi:ZIP family zinc transporter